MTYLTAFWEIFRFIKRYRERAEARLAREAAERADERAHMLSMLETVFSRTADAQSKSSESLIALANAQLASADVMKQWLDGFRLSPEASAPTPPQVVRPEEEWLREQLRLSKLGIDATTEIPAEFALALELAFNQDDNEPPSHEG